jgi:hypothetical protein
MPPTVSATAERMYDALRGYQQGDEDAGWPLLHLCEAAARTLARPAAALRYDDAGSGWRRNLDPTRAPDWMLGWLAQFAGIPSLTGLSVAQQRALIRDAPGMRRGTTAAIIAAPKPYLTGGQRVRLVERTPTAYRFVVITYATETPDPDAAQAALAAQKPVGLIMTYRIDAGWSIDEMETAEPDLDTLETDYTDLDALETHLP